MNIIHTEKEAYIDEIQALITVPDDFDAEKESLPVIVFLHGAGETRKPGIDGIEKVKVHGIPKYFSADPLYKGQRVITVSPQCPNGFIWDQLTFQLKDLLDKVIEKYNGNKELISITGISMGGYGTWNMITTFPGYFCCAAPVCGGGVVWRAEEAVKGLPIWALHSTDDNSVPFSASVDMIQRAEKYGAKVKFTAFTGLGHGCWTEAYENTDVIKWLAKGGNI